MSNKFVDATAPAKHDGHDDTPVLAADVPAGQLMHDDAPVDEL